MEATFLDLIEQLQPKPEYLRLFREVVLDVWKERQSEATKVASSIEARLEELAQRKQRVVDAFLYERVIDREVYEQQLDKLGEEIALAELEMHEARLEELDIEAALNFAIHALNNASRFWSECSPEQKQRFQRILFPEGLRYESGSFGTATTCLAFSYLREVSSQNSSLASRTGFEPVLPP